MNWEHICDIEKKQFEAMTVREKYIYLLLLQYRVPYVWGKELPTGADCSGAVSLALAGATGCVIRTTAEGLYRKFFTVRNPGTDDIQAVFFTTMYDRSHGNRLAKKGEVIHVAGVIHEGVVMNVVEPKADIRLVSSLRHSYSLMGCDLVIRGLDMKALQEASRNGTDLFGIDSEFSHFFGKEEAIAT